MAFLSCSDLHAGMGEAEIVAAIVGPLAQAGASGYATYATSKNAEKERKARTKELQVVAAQREREIALMAEAQRRAALVSQAKAYTYSQTAQVGLSALALVGVTLGVVYFLGRG